jgi:uncharacterized membrane protein
MDKFFGNLNAVLGVGFLLAVGLMFAPYFAPATVWLGVFQWLHVFFGITWIGLLYYFNFVQIPTMPSVPAELKPGVSKYIAPKALFYFRWGAAFTVLTGLILAYLYGELESALTLKPEARLIGIGMWLALVMAFNVWFVIWPNQKKALGLVEADADTKAKAAKTAMIFSRINTLLSIPMLLCMTAYR